MGQNKLAELEVLANKAECLANLALALEDAMFEGPNGADNYVASMNLLVDLMLEHSKAMQAYFSEIHAAQKAVAA